MKKIFVLTLLLLVVAYKVNGNTHEVIPWGHDQFLEWGPDSEEADLDVCKTTTVTGAGSKEKVWRASALDLAKIVVARTPSSDFKWDSDDRDKNLPSCYEYGSGELTVDVSKPSFFSSGRNKISFTIKLHSSENSCPYSFSVDICSKYDPPEILS